MSRRLVVVLLAALLTTGVFVSAAAAIAFTDESCANDSTCRPPHGTVGGSYYHKIQIREGGGTGPYTYTVSSGGLPAGLSLGSSSGEITGTPTASGSSTFYIDGGDACPDASSCIVPGLSPPCGGWVQIDTTCRYTHASAQRDFTIVIDPGLRIVTNDIPQNATVTKPYSAQLDAQLVTNLNPVTGTAAIGATWSVVSGVGTGLPLGLTLANGVISGTPTAEGAYSFRIQASLNSASHFQTYSLTVRQPLVVTPVKPLATSPEPTLWEIGVPFAAKLGASGGTGTYTWSLAAGALPTGLALAADGSLSGRPSAAGSFHATLRLTDTEGRTADYPAAFNVAPRLAISTLTLRVGKVGRLYRAKVAWTGGVLPKTWRITRGPLPRGIRFDRTLGLLSGTPTRPGRYRVTFEATDGLKVKAVKTLVIEVLA